MNRCTPTPPSTRRQLLTAVAATSVSGLGFSALAQSLPSDEPRNFPPHALFAELAIVNFPEVAINGKVIHTTPGFRLFSPERTLVFASSYAGQKFPAALLIEPQTEWLHTAWALTPAEIAKYKPSRPTRTMRLLDVLGL